MSGAGCLRQVKKKEGLGGVLGTAGCVRQQAHAAGWVLAFRHSNSDLRPSTFQAVTLLSFIVTTTACDHYSTRVVRCVSEVIVPP